MKWAAALFCLGSSYILHSQAITVYLHPAPPTSAPTHVDAGHASFALSRHLGLERFEKLGHGDGISLDTLQPEPDGLVGSAPRDGLLVTMSEADANGE